MAVLDVAGPRRAVEYTAIGATVGILTVQLRSSARVAQPLSLSRSRRQLSAV